MVVNSAIVGNSAHLNAVSEVETTPPSENGTDEVHGCEALSSTYVFLAKHGDVSNTAEKAGNSTTNVESKIQVDVVVLLSHPDECHG